MDSQDVVAVSAAKEISANKKPSIFGLIKSFLQSSLWLVFCIVLCFFIADMVESLNQVPSSYPLFGVISGNIAAVVAIFLLLATSIEDGKFECSFRTARRQISVAIVFIVLNEYIEPYLPQFLETPEQPNSFLQLLPNMGYIALLIWGLSKVVDKDESYKWLKYITAAIWLLTFFSFLLFIFLTYSNLVDVETRQQMLTTLQNLTSIIEELI